MSKNNFNSKLGLNVSNVLQQFTNSKAADQIIDITNSNGGVLSLTGPTGNQGPAGPQGIQGPMGPTGLQGIQGSTGLQGIQGIQGLQGPMGPIGIQGPTGLQGIQGLQGPTGIQGIQGLQGPTGIQGLQGLQGPTGIQGNIGATGIQGNIGPTGPTGFVSPIFNNITGNNVNITGNINVLNTSTNLRFGYQSLSNLTNGTNNIAIGYETLKNNSDGINNTANGNNSLFNNTAGNYNTAIGSNSLEINIDGSYNSALGYNTSNTASNGSNCVIIGAESLINGNNIIALGSGISSDNANKDFGFFIPTGVANAMSSGGNLSVPLGISKDGRIVKDCSSQRYKNNIEDIDVDVDTNKIYDLRPRSFNNLKENDPFESRTIGLIAEEVVELFPQIVSLDSKDNPDSINYGMLSVLLLSELKKQKEQIDLILERLR